MNITIPFSINQQVLIIPLDGHPGRIVKIILTDGSPSYCVEYWWNGKIEVAYVNALDIAPVGGVE